MFAQKLHVQNKRNKAIGPINFAIKTTMLQRKKNLKFYCPKFETQFLMNFFFCH